MLADLAAGTLLVYDHATDALTAPAKNAAVSASEQALKLTLLQRSSLWRTAAARAHRLEHGRTNDVTDAAGMADDYRLLAHDLAAFVASCRTRERISISRQRTRARTPHFSGAPGTRGTPSSPCFVMTFRGGELAQTPYHLGNPHLHFDSVRRLLAGVHLPHPHQPVRFARPGRDGGARQLWTDGILNVVPSSVLSLQILTNNIVVSLFAYCAGFLFGLGTLYILGLNGLMLGAVFAFTSLHGLDDDLFRFIVAHGCVELSVMCLSGAAGAAVGEALIHPTHASRLESFRIAAARSGKLLLACVVLLIGSGIIEGYVSPNPRFSLSTRVTIASATGCSCSRYCVAGCSGGRDGPPRP